VAKKIITLYLDTSTFGGYFDDIFLQDTRLLFEKIKSGKYKVFISSTTEEELENAPERVRNLLKEMKNPAASSGVSLRNKFHFSRRKRRGIYPKRLKNIFRLRISLAEIRENMYF